jgi:hypothetical protein
MRIWKENFSPYKEEFTASRVHIRLYSLSNEYWHLEILEGIANTLSSFVRIIDATQQGRYTSYAIIFVYPNVSKALPTSICLRYRDNDWIQMLDYEHIPSMCRKCHMHGHLFRDYPMNKQFDQSKSHHDKDEDNFEKVPLKCKTLKKIPIHPNRKGPRINNNFRSLESIFEQGNPTPKTTPEHQPDTSSNQDLNSIHPQQVDPKIKFPLLQDQDATMTPIDLSKLDP